MKVKKVKKRNEDRESMSGTDANQMNRDAQTRKSHQLYHKADFKKTSENTLQEVGEWSRYLISISNRKNVTTVQIMF